MTDWHLRELYDFLPSLGVTVISTPYSRYVVDLNRGPEDTLFGAFGARSLVPESTSRGHRVYQSRPSPRELESRLGLYYRPYHERLVELLTHMRDRFGELYLVDLHSFTRFVQEDVCLGTVAGRSCSERFVGLVEHAFADQGFLTVRDKRYTGGYITAHYSSFEGVEALQIELRRYLYLETDDVDGLYWPAFPTTKSHHCNGRLRAVFEKVVKALRPERDQPSREGMHGVGSGDRDL
jgi:formiminoglutamase